MKFWGDVADLRQQLAGAQRPAPDLKVVAKSRRSGVFEMFPLKPLQ
jgi:hypothetical protein